MALLRRLETTAVLKDAASDAAAAITTRMQQMGAAVRGASDAMEDHAGAQRQAGTAVADTERKVASGTRELQRARDNVEPLGKALRRLAADKEAVNRAYWNGTITDNRTGDILSGNAAYEERNRLLGLIAAKEQELMKRAGRDAANASALHSATAAYGKLALANDNLSTAVDRSAKSSLNLRYAMGQLSLQGQDVAVQLAGGTNALIVFAQQFPQIASAFGPAGAVIGLVGAAGAAAALALSNLGGAADASAKAADAAKASHAALEATIGKSVGSVEELTARYRSLSDEMKEVERVALAAAGRKLEEESTALRKAIDAELKRLEANRAAFESAARQPAAGAALDPARLAAFEAMRQTFAAIDRFRAGGSIQDVVGQLAALGDKGGTTSEALLKVSDGLVSSAKRAGELSHEAAQVQAQLALITGNAAGAGAGLAMIGKAAEDATSALAKLRTEQAKAGGKLFTTEQDLRAEIEALKGGEEGMKAFNREKARSKAWTDTYNAALKAGETALDAYGEANRVAGLAVEKFDLEQERATNKKASRAADAQARKEENAFKRVTEELDRQIAAEKDLAAAELLSGDARRKATVTAEVAERQSKALVKANSDEAKSIEAKVVRLDEEKQRRLENAAIRASTDELQLAQAELALAGQSATVREQALADIRDQQRATERFGSATSDTAQQWLALQRQIRATKTEAARTEEAWKAVGDSLERSFDRVGDALVQAFVSGKGEAIEFKGVVKGVIASIIADAAKLAIVNPIKNALFGTTSATIFDLFNRSGTAPTPAPAGNVASVVVNGVTYRAANGNAGAPSVTGTSPAPGFWDRIGMPSVGTFLERPMWGSRPTERQMQGIDDVGQLGYQQPGFWSAPTWGQGIGAAVGGFTTGYGVGSMVGPGNKTMSAIAGAGLGALQGFATGGPFGALIGGITGELGSLTAEPPAPSGEDNDGEPA